MPARREEKTIAAGACAQAKLFPEHIIWMAQLRSCIVKPSFLPAELFLPSLLTGAQRH